MAAEQGGRRVPGGHSAGLGSLAAQGEQVTEPLASCAVTKPAEIIVVWEMLERAECRGFGSQAGTASSISSAPMVNV